MGTLPSRTTEDNAKRIMPLLWPTGRVVSRFGRGNLSRFRRSAHPLFGEDRHTRSPNLGSGHSHRRPVSIAGRAKNLSPRKLERQLRSPHYTHAGARIAECFPSTPNPLPENRLRIAVSRSDPVHCGGSTLTDNPEEPPAAIAPRIRPAPARPVRLARSPAAGPI